MLDSDCLRHGNRWEREDIIVIFEIYDVTIYYQRNRTFEWTEVMKISWVCKISFSVY
jgi:hypothetical protein